MTNIIGFPSLGLEFSVNRIAFSIGTKPVYWYALCILAGFFLGMAFVCATCKKRGVTCDTVTDICLWGLIFGIIGARLYYCIFDWSSVGGFWGIFKIWEGGLAIFGGLIAAVITVIVYCKIKKRDALRVLDVCVPGVFIGQIVGRWGNFFNAEVFGRETDFFLRMTINGGAGVHPLFLYEGLWNLLGLILLLLYRRKDRPIGTAFCFYIAWYGIGRLFLEGMRQSEYILYLLPGVGVSQVVSAVCIIAGILGMVYFGRKKKR